MIEKNEMEQWIGCTVCGEQIELRRKTLQDPETVLIMMERLRADHEGCEEFPDNPGRREAELTYRRNMRREFAKASRLRIVASSAGTLSAAAAR